MENNEVLAKMKCKKCKKLLNENEGFEVGGYLDNIILLCDECYKEYEEFETAIFINKSIRVYYKNGDVEAISSRGQWINYLNVTQEKKAEKLMLKEFLNY